MNNPFEFMQSFMNNNNFFTKNMPEIDFSSATNMMKNTAETITAINQKTAENFQSVLKKSTDSLQKNSTEMYNAMKEATATGDVAQINNCQQKCLRSMTDSNINGAKEIIEVATKSMMEVLDTFRSNMNANTHHEKPKK